MFYKKILLFTAFSFFYFVLKAQDTANVRFSFVVLGDMPYNLPQDDAQFERLITFLNLQGQKFNVFVGDIKSSRTDCSNDVYYKMYNYFNSFLKPLIYTPGDNEWTDCSKPGITPYNPEERLSFLRQVFYKKNQSLGKTKMTLFSEANIKGYSKFVENNLWQMGGITFSTVHVVGSNNNYKPADTGMSEFAERSAADIFWLQETFKKAKASNSLGLVIFLHADMFVLNEPTTGFETFLNELTHQARAYDKPILLINGDSHKFLVDKPLRADDISLKTLLNFTRVQVFGEDDMDAVKVIVDPDMPGLFEIQQLIF